MCDQLNGPFENRPLNPDGRTAEMSSLLLFRDTILLERSAVRLSRCPKFVAGKIKASVDSLVLLRPNLIIKVLEHQGELFQNTAS
jgi:hypothetical protein